MRYLITLLIIILFCSCEKHEHRSSFTGNGWTTIIGDEWDVSGLYRFIDKDTCIVIYWSSEGRMTSQKLTQEECKK